MRRYAVEVTYKQRSNGIRMMRVYYLRATSHLDATHEAKLQAQFDKLADPLIGKVYPVSQIGE